MGRDVFIFRPPDGASPDESFPPDEEDLPGLGTREAILTALRQVADEVVTPNPEEIELHAGECHILMNLSLGEGQEDQVKWMVLNVYGTGCDPVLLRIAESLRAVAFDVGEGTQVR